MTATFYSPKAQLGHSIETGLQINGEAYPAHMQNQACLKDIKTTTTVLTTVLTTGLTTVLFTCILKLNTLN